MMASQWVGLVLLVALGGGAFWLMSQGKKTNPSGDDPENDHNATRAADIHD